MLITVTERYKTDKLPQDTLTPPPKLDFLNESILDSFDSSEEKLSFFRECIILYCIPWWQLETRDCLSQREI